ncbi:MAG: hypothetical protein AABZ06_04535 [Bdellovibrionota bacterium]
MQKIKFIALAILSTMITAGYAASTDNKQDIKPLWDYWYTITVDKKIPYAYYNERVEKKNDRLFIQTHVWKLEEDFINEEQLGAFAANNAELTPLFYNFHSKYRQTETNVDGTVSEKNVLTVKVRKGPTEDTAPMKRVLKEKVFFSQFFPVWLGMKLPSLKPSKSIPFEVVLEDNIELEFVPTQGRVRLEAPDEFAKSTKTQKIWIYFRGTEGFWWVDSSGAALKIEMPKTKTVVERSTKEKATKFITTN